MNFGNGICRGKEERGRGGIRRAGRADERHGGEGWVKGRMKVKGG